MMIYLLSMLFCQPLANQNNIHQCFCHGYVYTYTKQGVVDSVELPIYIQQIEAVKDYDLKIKAKEDLIKLINDKPCPKR